MTAIGAPPANALQALAAGLRGSEPQHGRAAWRLGASLAAETIPGLDQLLTADPVAAAVLVGIVDHPGDPAVLLTVRASRMRKHAGQIAFPGGRVESDDASPTAAALREAREEIGLDAHEVEVLGFLPDHLVLTGYRVTPVVARVLPGATLQLEASEVEALFELPWSVLENEANIERGERVFGGVNVPVRDIHYGAHRIWGLTAAILLLLRDVARGATP
jgi:8-oxo-dGTP pyrophosphatase MutT (NUDIX family)